MKTFVRCGQLFTGSDDEAAAKQTMVYDEDGVIAYVGAEPDAPRRARSDRVLDYSGLFVMPGLIDVHTHLAYGNAKSEEDIDLYSPLEFRALRGMFFAQKMVAAGFTALCSPPTPGRSACRSATQSAPACSTARGSWRPGRTSPRIRA
jgi:imidazolonepropionase-like amidohydrolase